MSIQTTFKSVYRPVTKVIDETLFTSVLDFSGRATSLDFTEVQAVTFDALDNIQHFVDGQIVIISNRSPQNIYINSSLIIANKTIEIKPNSASIFIYLFSRSRFFDITNSGQIDDIQAAVDLINLNIDSIESLITSQYQELNQKIILEESARALGDQNLSSRISTLELDPVTKAYVDAQDTSILQDLSVEITDRLAGDQNLQTQINTITGGGSGSISSLQAELDTTQLGAGLESDGSYIADGSSPVIRNATSLKNADEILEIAISDVVALTGRSLNQTDLGSFGGSTIPDNQTIKEALQTLELAIEAVSGGSSSTQIELDATQIGAGLETDGSYLPNPNKAYINDATSLKSATEILDDELFSVSNDLTQEILDREQADEETLASSKSYTDSQVAIEAAARVAADANLQNQINNVLSNIDLSALDSLTEIVAAFEAADASLNGAITTLSTNLSQQINALDAELDQEKLDRQAGDSGLDTRITALEQQVGDDLQAAITSLETAITAEQTARIAADSAEVLARQTADTALDTRITELENEVGDNLQAAITNLQTAITNEETARVAADLDITNRITALESEVGENLQAAISQIQSDIASEATTRAAADTLLQTNINNVQSSLTQETNNRIAADQELQTGLDAEILRATTAETSLQNQLDSLTTDDVAEASNLYYTDSRVQTKLGNVSGHIIPDTDELYDIGSPTKKFRDLYLSGLTLYLGNLTLASDQNAGLVVRDSNSELAISSDSIKEGLLNKFFTESRVQDSTLSLLDVTKSGDVLSTDSLIDGLSKLQNSITSEVARAQSAELALQSNITTEEAARIAGDQFLQNQISNILNNIDPEALDSLAEIVASLQNAEANINTTISNLSQQFNQDLTLEIQNRIAGDNLLQSNLNTETSEREAADNEINSLLDAYGAVLGKLTYKEERESFVVDAGMLANGYFDLEYEAVDDSILLRVDRLYFHEDFDFYAEKINGITRIHFSGAIAPGGSQALEINENIYIKYERLMDVFGFPIEDAIGRVIPAKGDYHKTLTDEDIQNGYIDLPTKIVENSLISHSGRLALIEEFDYNLELVNNKTRIVFAGPSAAGGSQALEAGSDPDTLHFKYEYYYN